MIVVKTTPCLQHFGLVCGSPGAYGRLPVYLLMLCSLFKPSNASDGRSVTSRDPLFCRPAAVDVIQVTYHRSTALTVMSHHLRPIVRFKEASTSDVLFRPCLFLKDRLAPRSTVTSPLVFLTQFRALFVGISSLALSEYKMIFRACSLAPTPTCNCEQFHRSIRQ